jgi:hypothetical protein
LHIQKKVKRLKLEVVGAVIFIEPSSSILDNEVELRALENQNTFHFSTFNDFQQKGQNLKLPSGSSFLSSPKKNQNRQGSCCY